MFTPDASTRTTLAILMLLILALRETHAPAKPLYQAGIAGLRERGTHAGLNLVLGFFNNTLAAVTLAGAWAFAAAESGRLHVGVLHFALPHPWLHAVGALLLLDLWTYAWHRLNHTLPFLWRFHRLHHSDRTMDVSTASRFHTVEILLSGALRVPLIFLTGVTPPPNSPFTRRFFLLPCSFTTQTSPCRPRPNASCACSL